MVIDASAILRGFFPDEAGQAEAYALIRACAQEEVALLALPAIGALHFAMARHLPFPP
jgi:hypothetical protein